jgi:hypothetical protein
MMKRKYKRTQEAIDSLTRDANPFEDPLVFEKRVERTIGKAPYEFATDESSLPLRFPTKKKRNILPAVERAKNPQPNYQNFTPQFIDWEGREYAVNKGSVRAELVEQGMDTAPEYETSDLKDWQYIAKKAFNVRLPIDTRHEVEQLDVGMGNTNLELFEVDTQVLCQGIIQDVYFYPKRRTGFVILRDFVTMGKAKNGKEWRERIDLRKRPPITQL